MSKKIIAVLVVLTVLFMTVFAACNSEEKEKIYVEKDEYDFVTDENGELLLVYHARPESHLHGECGTYCEESLYDPCRHARIRKVRFDENGVPVLK